ncbi:cytochrome P450 [Rhizodiscina lignyota]|uniref:Cytochrome P450 n=1 Tax=Rhizodiscina lignyota TaxID=1504668 RepID=A0A9P4M0Y0_9PEZI|nr:cytochrome P450 [Rhizodiscina lignyota]
MAFIGSSLGNIVALACTSYFAYWCFIYIYRITLHPLAKFPGPKLAAVSFWYEFYYDLWKPQQYLWKIKELHEQYGPIVRINPIHIHIIDSDYWDEIYSGTVKRDKCGWFMNARPGTKSVMNGSTFLTMEHEAHKRRRAAISPFFSKRSIRNIDQLVREKVEQVTTRYHDDFKNGKVINLSEANTALTLDVISSYCWGEGMRTLDQPEYGKFYRDMMMAGVVMNPLSRQFPNTFNLLNSLPLWMAEALNPIMAPQLRLNERLLEIIRPVLAGDDDGKDLKHRTVFHDIKDSTLPSWDKTPERLLGECVVFLGAGTETTARTLSVTAYYIIATPGVQERLYEELKQAMPKKHTFQDGFDALESLQYLSACINEGLRLAHGVSTREPRIARDVDLKYKGWIIPRGTPVMQSLYIAHLDPEIFPEPFQFKPERWLNSDAELKRHFMPFGKGPRSCVGINLAIAELASMTAYLFRRFQVELYETIEERDVLTTRDCFIGMTDASSPGIRVKIVRERED